jgi:glycerol-3-phosphate dehydrogenase
MIGTSDIPIDDADEARCTEAEVDYFFEMIARIFPDIKIEREQIVFRFSGVRPLEYSQAKTTGQISRDHSIKEDKIGNIPVYSLVGGKWTSYRAFAEETTDRALAFLGQRRLADTKQLPIGGGCDYTTLEETPEGSTPLFARYGSRCYEVAAYQARDNRPLKFYPTMTRGEVAFLAEKEKVAHLDDLILRRSLMAYLGQLNRPLIDELANILGEVLGWNDTQRREEVERTLDVLDDRHGVSLSKRSDRAK